MFGRTVQKALRRLSKAVLFTLNATWAFPAILVIRAIRPLVHVRMGILESSRIGHFITDASLFLARWDVQPPNKRTIDLFCFSSRPCNEQWARMVRRKLSIHWWVKYLVCLNRFLPGGTSHDLIDPTTSANRDIYGILRRSSARIEFTSEEEENARVWLRRHGWKDGEPFICLLVRDSAYLASVPTHSDMNNDHWNYHNYRDSDIESFVEASQILIDHGYWVIRMGKTAHKRLPLRHQRVIDYPFVEDQDDLLDIWLSINCHFFVATGSGIDTLPWIYGKQPVVYVNALPLAHCATSVNHIWVPKHLHWKKTGNLLTLKEHCQHCYFRSEEYEQAGIAIEDLSSTEITAAVMECEMRVNGTWIETEENQKRQRRFWEVLRSWSDFSKYHGDIHPEARVGCAWLKSMGDAFLE